MTIGSPVWLVSLDNVLSWPYGSRASDANRLSSSRSRKRAASTISRTSVVLPVWRGPTILITRVVRRVLASFSVRCRGIRVTKCILQKGLLVVHKNGYYIWENQLLLKWKLAYRRPIGKVGSRHHDVVTEPAAKDENDGFLPAASSCKTMLSTSEHTDANRPLQGWTAMRCAMIGSDCRARPRLQTATICSLRSSRKSA